jgi:FkbM family methyltransferase
MTIERFSLYDLMPDLPAIEVLDVGAAQMGDAVPPYGELVRGGRARVTGFEPNLSGCVALNQRYGRPHRFFPQFVGAGGPAKFYQTNSPFTGSLFPPNEALLGLFTAVAALTRLVAVEDVQTVRIDDIAEITDVDFFKIDVQGAELATFHGAEKALAAAVVIQTEVEFVELYRGQALFADIDAHLRSRGFVFQHFDTFGTATAGPPLSVAVGHGNPASIQMLWNDAIYIKDPLRLDLLSDVKLRKLAVLLHDLYGTCDFAHFFLQAADARGGEPIAARYAEKVAAS